MTDHTGTVKVQRLWRSKMVRNMWTFVPQSSSAWDYIERTTTTVACDECGKTHEHVSIVVIDPEPEDAA